MIELLKIESAAATTFREECDRLREILKEIHKAVASVSLFSSEAEQHKQMDHALREIGEILEEVGIS